MKENNENNENIIVNNLEVRVSVKENVFPLQSMLDFFTPPPVKVNTKSINDESKAITRQCYEYLGNHGL